MFEIFFYSILILILFTPFGYFLIQNFESNLYGFSKQLIFGSVILSFLAITIHFFFPLNLITNSIILIFSLIILIKKKKILFYQEFYYFFNSTKFINNNFDNREPCVQTRCRTLSLTFYWNIKCRKN